MLNGRNSPKRGMRSRAERDRCVYKELMKAIIRETKCKHIASAERNTFVRFRR